MTRIAEIGSMNLGYPLFASAFSDESELIVAGGGGEGHNGIKNKITLLGSGKDALEVLAEYELPIDEDNPTSLDLSQDGVIYAGVNRSSKQVKAGQNDHLRVFTVTSKENEYKLLENGSYTVFGSDSVAAVPGDYQKITRVNEEAQLLAIASASQPGKLIILGLNDLKIKFELVPEDQGEIKDIGFDITGRYVASCTSKNCYIYDLMTGEPVGHVASPETNLSFSKINLSRAFVADTNDVGPLRLDAVFNVAGRKGFTAYSYHVKEEDIVSENTEENNGEKLRRSPRKRSKPKPNKRLLFSVLVMKRICKKGSCVAFTAGSSYTAFASSDFSVYVCSSAAQGFSVLKRFDQTHSFAVTSVALSPDESRLASTSVDNTVKLYHLPRDNHFLGYGLFQALFWAIIAAVLVLFSALILEKVIQRQVISELIKGNRINLSGLTGAGSGTGTGTDEGEVSGAGEKLALSSGSVESIGTIATIAIASMPSEIPLTNNLDGPIVETNSQDVLAEASHSFEELTSDTISETLFEALSSSSTVGEIASEYSSDLL